MLTPTKELMKIPTLGLIIPPPRFATPVMKANIVPSTLFGVILAIKASIGKVLNAIPTPEKATS